MIQDFNEVLTQVIALDNKKIAVCKAENEEVLQAVEMARQKGIADAILVGDEAKTRKMLAELNISADNYTFINNTEADEVVALETVKLVSSGQADVLMKGLISTGLILKAVLNKEHGLRMAKVISHVAVFDIPSYHKLLLLTDAAINITPDADTKEQIINNATHVTQAFGIDQAKVALVAAKEKVSEKMPATIDAQDLRSRTYAHAIVDGPFALDNAISAESVKIKGIESPVAGDADVVLMPQIEAANVLYKALTYFSDAQCAGIIVGAKRPIVLTSRADDEQTKLNSIATAILVSEKMKEL